MSTKSAPFYWIECDAPDCDERTPGGYDDVMAYMEIDQVIDDAESSEWVIDHKGTGKDYCPNHKPAECDCDLLEKPDSQPPCETFRIGESVTGFCATCGHLEECHS